MAFVAFDFNLATLSPINRHKVNAYPLFFVLCGNTLAIATREFIENPLPPFFIFKNRSETFSICPHFTHHKFLFLPETNMQNH